MIRSMTGYGRGEAADGASVVVEMRSVNNRYLDIQVKTPRSMASLEPRIRKAVQAAFSRGRIDVFVNRSGGDANPIRLVPAHDVAEQYIRILRELKERHALSGEIDIAMISAIPDVIAREEVPEDTELLWRSLDRALSAAAASLRSMREQEGRSLVDDVSGRLTTIEQMIGEIGKRAPATVEMARKRMADALEKVLKEQPDPARVAQEIAILAERTDISEELTRLVSHMAQFRTMLAAASGEPIGRKLDFLIQEMGREVNTIASKALDADISLQVVQIKSELEKIREQVQNIE